MNKISIGLGSMLVLASAAHAGPIDTLQPGEWYEVPNTKMSTVDPCPANNCSYSGTNGQMSVTTGWNSGVYDTQRDRLVLWGGGHAGYGGNELYAFDIATLQWIRINEPSQLTAGDFSTTQSPNDAYYNDGTPSQRHTYDSLVYAANVDRFFATSVGAHFGDYTLNFHEIDSFDFDSKTWKTDWVSRTAVSNNDDGSPLGVISVYDPATGMIWSHTTLARSRLGRFDPNAAGGKGEWKLYGSSIYLDLYSKATIDTKRHRMVTLGTYSDQYPQLLVWDLNNPQDAPTKPTTSGDATGKSLELAKGPGFEYDPVSDRYVAWYGGTDVYLLNPDTWVWTRVTPAATNTVPASKLQREGSGTYGRFRYIPSKNAFIVVNSTFENVFFYKLSPGDGIVVEPEPDASGPDAGATNPDNTTTTKQLSGGGEFGLVEALLGLLLLAALRAP
jgi:hypothetical protein